MNEKEILMFNSIKSSLTMAEAARKSGVHYSTLKTFALKNNIFKPNQSKRGTRVKKIEELLVDDAPVNSSYLKQRLIEEKVFDYVCFECGIKKWNNKDIVLELDHIDGDRVNNKINNLRLLCPNCHSQTLTFRNRDNKNNVLSIKNEFIVECFNKSNSFNEFCNNLGLKNRGNRMITLINRLGYLGLKFEKKEKNINIKKLKKTNKKNFCNICDKKISNSSKFNLCVECSKIKQRKVERPSLEILLKEIEKFGYCAAGRKYGVSDNAIRKWINYYKKNMAS